MLNIYKILTSKTKQEGEIVVSRDKGALLFLVAILWIELALPTFNSREKEFNWENHWSIEQKSEWRDASFDWKPHFLFVYVFGISKWKSEGGPHSPF